MQLKHLILLAGCLAANFSCQKGAQSPSATTQVASSNPAPDRDEIARQWEKRIDTSSQYMETELAKWSPSSEDMKVPRESLRDRSMNVTGEWIGRTGMDYAALSIKPRSGNEYDVTFATGGCLSDWQLRRIGKYAHGVLTLDRPVQEYCPITFKTLYAIRIDGKELLLPAGNTTELMEDVDSDGHAKSNSIGVSFYTYGRAADRREASWPFQNFDEGKK